MKFLPGGGSVDEDGLPLYYESEDKNYTIARLHGPDGCKCIAYLRQRNDKGSWAPPLSLSNAVTSKEAVAACRAHAAKEKPAVTPA